MQSLQATQQQQVIMASQLRNKHRVRQPFEMHHALELSGSEAPNNRKIDQLTFFDSDDDDKPIKSETTSSFLQTGSKREVHSFMGTSAAMRPSIMQASVEDSYDDIINCEEPNKNRTQNKSRHKRPRSRGMQQSRNHDFTEQALAKQSKREQRTQLRQFQRLTFSLQEDDGPVELAPNIQSPSQNPKHEKSEKKQELPILIPKIQVSGLYFQESEDEEPAKSAIQELPQPERTSQQQLDKNRPSAADLSSKIQMAQPEEEEEDQSSPKMRAPEQHHIEAAEEVDIACLQKDQKLQERSLYLVRFLRESQTAESRLSAMVCPIFPGTRQIFQAHVYTSVSQKEYFLWLDMGPEMTMLMKARKFPHVNRTEIQLTTYNPSRQEYSETCRLISNFDRSRYNIIMDERRTGRRRIFGTICVSNITGGLKSIVMYYPRLNERFEPTIFYHLGEYETDLQMIYRENKVKEIDYLMTTRLQMAKKLHLMSYYQLRASQKSMEFKSRDGKMSLIIGKKGSKRYKLIAGPGLTPAQIFSLLIVQVET